MEQYEEFFQCFNRHSNGVIARKDEEWVILKGSKIASEDTCSYAKTGRTKRLVKNGYIQSGIFIKDYSIRTKTVGVSIIGRHGVSACDAEKKSCRISSTEAMNILEHNLSLADKDKQSTLENGETPINEFQSLQSSEFGINMYEKLVTDATFQKLKYCQKEINIFSIVGQTHTEHWHSSFLKWLFDPKSSLKLGTYALERLLYLYMLKRENGCICFEDIEN